MPRKKYAKLLDIVGNEDGIALVTSLMLTLISLAIIMSLLYLITNNVQRSGATKRYKSALEASYGGAEIFVKDIFPLIMQNSADPQLINTLQNAYGTSLLTVTSPQVAGTSCLVSKLTKATTDWASACTSTLNPKAQPDIQLSLPGTNDQPFRVYSKIVDTVTGNSDLSGLQLGGAGVAEGQSLIIPQHFPFVYRLEVQGERTTNAVEKSNISILYAY